MQLLLMRKNFSTSRFCHLRKTALQGKKHPEIDGIPRVWGSLRYKSKPNTKFLI